MTVAKLGYDPMELDPEVMTPCVNVRTRSYRSAVTDSLPMILSSPTAMPSNSLKL